MANEQHTADVHPDDRADVAELTNEYELRGVLGRGGTAVVYRGYDRALHREVAIKVVHRSEGADDAVARLAREARTVAQLQHLNIVGIHAVRRLRSGGLALVMQYVPGTTLKTLIQARGPLAPDRAERIMRDVAGALAYAHARGIVHRDVKPENIFLDAESGRALLADFGIARSGQPDAVLAQGTALGTPSYMSPEQVNGDALDGRSDVYSLGLVTWEMLTGLRPWDGHSLYDVIHKQRHEELPPIEALRPGEVPLRLQYIVERMLQKRPAARWAGADGLLAQLNHAVLPSDYARWQASLKVRVKAWREQEGARTRPPAPSGALQAKTVQFRVKREGGPAPWAAGGARGQALAAAARESQEAVTAAVTFDERGRPMIAPVATVPVGEPVVLDAPTGVSAPVGAESATAPAVPAQYDVAEPEWARLPPSDVRAAIVPRGRMLMSAAAGVVLLGTGAAGAFWRAPLARQLGLAASPPAAAPAPATPEAPAGDTPAAYPVGGSGAVLAAGGRHACILTVGGGAACWGANEYGQLGDRSRRARPTPAPVAGARAFVQVSAGRAHSCAVTADGEASCWGANGGGQLGDGTGSSRTAPVPVGGGVRFSAVFAGGSHSCGITFTGNVWCWGANQRGQLGIDASVAMRRAPVAVNIPDGARVSTLALGRDHSCALDVDGRAFCWGANEAGQLGDGGRSDRRAPKPVRSTVRFETLAAGRAHSCATTADRRVACWGDNADGQLGVDGTRRRSTRPTFAALPTGAQAVGVATGARTSCAFGSGGETWCWGRTPEAQAGVEPRTARRPPRVLFTDEPVAAVALAEDHGCALTGGGQLQCWGSNTAGQLGDGTRAGRPRPTAIALGATRVASPTARR